MTKTMEAMLSKSAKLRDLHAQIGGADDTATTSTRSVIVELSTFYNQTYISAHVLCWSPCRDNVQTIIDAMDSHYDDVATSLARFRSSSTLTDTFLGLNNMPNFNLPYLHLKLLRLKAHISKLLEDAEILFLVMFNENKMPPRPNETKFTDAHARKLDDSGQIRFSNLSKGKQSHACWDDVPVWGSMDSPKLWG